MRTHGSRVGSFRWRSTLSAALGLTLAVASMAPGQIAVEEWVATYDGPTSQMDVAVGVAVDKDGNVYVTGQSHGPTDQDIATVKYDANGNMLWVARYDGPASGHDGGSRVVRGKDDTIYVRGIIDGPQGELAVIKYDADGNELWVARYPGATGGGWRTEVDQEGNVYTSSSTGPRGSSNALVVSYDSDGNMRWDALYPGGAGGYAGPPVVALTREGSVYALTGDGPCLDPPDCNDIDYDNVILAYDGSNGDLRWTRTRRYEPHPATMRSGGQGAPAGLATDRDENVYALFNYLDPASHDKDWNLDLVKYDSSGNELWVRTYDGASPRMSDDRARALGVDRDGRVFLVGVDSASTGGNKEVFLVSYDPEGNERWVTRCGTGEGCPSSFAENVMEWRDPLPMDNEGNFYLFGLANPPTSAAWTYRTVAYNPDGNQLWIADYQTTHVWSHPDGPNDLAVDDSQNVYVTGGDGDRPDMHYATVKYAQVPDPGAIDEAIQGIPEDSFKNSPDERKKALSNKLDVIRKHMEEGRSRQSVSKLEHDILDKIDKWITDRETRQELREMVEALIGYLERQPG